MNAATGVSVTLDTATVHIPVHTKQQPVSIGISILSFVLSLAAVCKLHRTNMTHVDLQIGSLSVGPEADAQFVQLYVIFMNQLVTVLPITADIPRAYEQGSDDEQEFVQNLAIFLTGFLKVRHTPHSTSWANVAFNCWVPAAQHSKAVLGEVSQHAEQQSLSARPCKAHCCIMTIVVWQLHGSQPMGCSFCFWDAQSIRATFAL